ncbi:MAG: beta-propeller fold lactonase family protein [Solirubrobacteraceae bacterium]
MTPIEALYSARKTVAVTCVLVCVSAVGMGLPSVGMGQTRWSGRGLAGLLDQAGSSAASSLDLRAPLSGSFGSIEPGAPPSVAVGANPSGLAASEATHTVYSVNQNDNTVSVIDAQGCNAQHPAGCGHALATIKLGGSSGGPVGAILTRDGDTLYVTASGDNAVAVVDASTCNAIRTSGCARGPVAMVATGQVPVAMVEDPQTHTLYVANVFSNTVSVIDAARCNADETAGCGQAPATVPVGTGPSALALERETHTLYVANVDDNTVSVIDAARCNAEQTHGCGNIPPAQAVGGAPAAISFSERSDTVYVANGALNREGALVPYGNTVSVLDAAACNAEHPQGCSAVPPPAVPVGSQPGGYPQALIVDQRTQNVYVPSVNDDTLSVIDGARCNARRMIDCAKPAPTVQMGAGPQAVAVVPSVHTVYVADGIDGAVAVIEERTCNDEYPAGCRPAAAPAAPLAPNDQLAGAAIDAADHTAYVINGGVNFDGPNVLDLIDTARCHTGSTSGCTPHPPLATVALASPANAVAVDPSTDTVYVAEGNPGPGNPGPAELEVIAAATCNATVSTCAHNVTISLSAGGNFPGPLAVDSATNTVYVGNTDNTAVIDARHCKAADITGCATQPAATIPVASPNGFGVAPDTLYATTFSDPTVPGAVDVIDTRHCQAADTTQCATQNPATATVGLVPTDTAVDVAHHTLYVPDNAQGEGAGLLSMIDTTHCNGDDTSDCASQTPPTTPMRRAPLAATLDPSTSTLYITNFNDADVSLINTTACNSTTLAGCPRVPPQMVTGSGPSAAALDPATHTIYVPSFFDGTVSIIATDDPASANR